MGHHNLRAEPLIIGAKSAVEGVDAMKPARKRRERKPSVGTLIKQAEKAGKTVTSVTVDGVTLMFDQPSPAKHSSWDDLETGTRQ